MELWKEVLEFSGYYVSNTGKVKTNDFNHTGLERELSVFVTSRGYVAVNLMRNGIRRRKLLHQLVSIAFIENKNNRRQVNHKNGIKTDNNVDNLEWCTSAENIQHAFRNGLNKASKGESHYGCKISDEEVREIRKLRLFGMRLKTISKLYGVRFTTISSICTKKARV